MTNPTMIGIIKDGLRKDVKPFATPEDSFETLFNAYQFRGRIVRRNGYNLLGRLQLSFTDSIVLTTNSGQSGTLSHFPIVQGTVNLLGSSDGTTYTDPAMNGVLVATGGTGVGGTINYATGVIFIQAGGGQTMTGTYNYYPLLPVMGLKTQELFAIDQQALISFDTQTAYLYTSPSFAILPSKMPVTWNGSNSQFFISINYAGAFWATNSNPGLNGYNVSAFTGASGTSVNVTSTGNTFKLGDQIYFLNVTGAAAVNNLRYGTVTAAGNPFTFTASDGAGNMSNGAATTGIALSSTRQTAGQDGIRYYASVSNAGGSIGDSWVNYNPPIDPNTALCGCLLMFAYRGYLVFLNTYEGNDQGVFNYPNRARWTEIGTPYYSYPVPNTPSLQGVEFRAARDDLFGKGGSNDAPTNETIVAAGFIRDIIVVYFERSTWRLRFVNNAQNPFVWERINIEFGSECTYSAVPFDKGLMAIGNRGILISDGNDVIRFDEKIPNDVFTIRQTNDGFERVNGIRSFRTRLVYWTFPSIDYPLHTYPDYILVYNYETQNWSYFDDTFTCFGYNYPTSAGKRWIDLPLPWPEYTHESAATGVTQEGFETVVSGNQQGFVFSLEQTGSQNDPSLAITAITLSTASTPTIINSPNYNLPDGSWIYLTGILGTTSSDGVSLNGRNFKISVIDANTFSINEFQSIDGGSASGSNYSYTIGFVPILPGSILINIGILIITDTSTNGNLYDQNMNFLGNINYTTGQFSLTFSSPISPTEVYIRYVSVTNPNAIYPQQQIVPVQTTTAYLGGGTIGKISNFNITTKIFNFLPKAKRTRLSKIDFYVDNTESGQFNCDIYPDSSNVPVNTPLPDNKQSNTVLTTFNPYQFGGNYSDETIYRLYADAIGQTLQFMFYLSDSQIATDIIASSDVQLLSFILDVREGGRLI